MKNTQQKLTLFTTALVAILLLAANPAKATNYAGNGSSSFGNGGVVGNGTLTVTDDGTNLTFRLQTPGGNFGGNALALYIDTGATGFADTSGFTDTGDGGRIAISGYNGGSSRSTMTFASGFRPTYAIACDNGYASLFSLVNGGSHGWIAGASQSGGSTYTLTVAASQIGLTAGHTATIRVFGSLISESAWRSSEAIAGNDTTVFTDGYNPFTQTAYGTYIFAPAVVVTYPVTFIVDMTEQIATGAFVPANGDTINAAGSFESTPWSASLQLAPSAGNANIYTGTYQDANLLGTTETYKFRFHSVANGDSWENDPNRTFMLQSGGQNLPVVYFNNLAASPSASTNVVQFRIDMGPQAYLGNFNPGNGDQIEVFGAFQTPSGWSSGFILTNNSASAQSNIYSGSYTIYNYPSTVFAYKYVIVNGANNNYESGSDRSLVTPTNSATLALAYFNGVSNIYSTPITFQVDMTVPIVSGTFNPGSGDTVSAAGSFQTNTWNTGVFILTNNPSGGNAHLYTGTYLDRNQPGAGEQYKFVITSSTATNYETISGNRTFLLGSTAQTLPVVFWNNLNTNQFILAATTVTFTVDMTGAVDVYGFPFDTAHDSVVINGDFATPAWNSYPNNSPAYFWTDTYFYDPIDNISDYGPGNPYGPNFILQDSGDGQHFTGTFTIPAGHSYQVNYKYGIYHNNSAFLTNCDNEAFANNDHHRYVRANGTYNFPTDIFGVQRPTNPNSATATEPLYGIALGHPSAGHLSINWLGFAGVLLQSSTNLVNPVWQNVSGSGGAGSTNWPMSSGAQFFRMWPTPQQ